MENGKRNCKCSSLGPVLPCRACLCACLPFLLCLQSTSTHTSLPACIGYQGTDREYFGTQEHCGCPWPLLMLLAPSQVSVSARSSHVELRELITHHVLHPAPFLGTRTAGGHTHTQPFFLSCQYEPARVRDWSQGVTHLLLW